MLTSLYGRLDKVVLKVKEVVVDETVIVLLLEGVEDGLPPFGFITVRIFVWSTGDVRCKE